MFLFIFIDVIAIVCLLIGIFTSILIISVSLIKLNRLNRITNLLLGNTCLSTTELCVSFLWIYLKIFLNDLKKEKSFENLSKKEKFCEIRSYLLFSGFSLLYTSYCLQAYYRLRQVKFYHQNKKYGNYISLCILQWILSFALVLPMLLNRSFVYISSDYFCPIPFSKPLSVLYIAISVYGIFIIIFSSIYIWIYRYANKTTLITIQRRRAINRQLIMLKRMMFPTFSLIFLGIVYLILFFQSVYNQYQTHYLTYRLSYLFIAIGMSFIHLITIFQTPLLRKTIQHFFCAVFLNRRLEREEHFPMTSRTTNQNGQQKTTSWCYTGQTPVSNLVRNYQQESKTL